MATVSFRCSDREKLQLEEWSNGNLTAYITGVLFGEDDTRELVREAVDLLHDMDQRLAANGRAGGKGQGRTELGMLTELLLLLRQTVKPDVMRQAQAEVERLGLDVWSAPDSSE